jgi:hypothetical protein
VTPFQYSSFISRLPDFALRLFFHHGVVRIPHSNDQNTIFRGVFADAPATNVHASAPKIDVIFVFKVFVVPVPFNSSPGSWSPRRGAHENGKV